MEAIGIFDLFKIGVGPSSSHTMGPWLAVMDFMKKYGHQKIDKLQITLHGSLALTGKGHGTDLAIFLALMGYDYRTSAIAICLEKLKETGDKIEVRIGPNTVIFSKTNDLLFSKKEKVKHPNTMTFRAYSADEVISSHRDISLGGGFIEEEGSDYYTISCVGPHPIQSSKELRNELLKSKKRIWEVMLSNELATRSLTQIDREISALFNTMKSALIKGLNTSGELPGGLRVKRRAQKIASALVPATGLKSFLDLERSILQNKWDFSEVNNWISCFAMATNEENASMGKIVTAPTNGACGVIPAVLFYRHFFFSTMKKEDLRKFFLVAGIIGILFKNEATISGAMGGCQAEIGVSAAMAAAGLTQLLGGTDDQILMAAEIAMEHHLGLTCDPVGGLVQIPCIERNSMGAIKAITAANLAMKSDPKDSVVKLDNVIQTMWETAKSMNRKYKETSLGGLAIHVPVINPEC